jgi:hypothetical protein
VDETFEVKEIGYYIKEETEGRTKTHDEDSQRRRIIRKLRKCCKEDFEAGTGIVIVAKRGRLSMDLRSLNDIMSSPQMTHVSMNQQWNDTDRGKPKDSENNLSQCHFVHHKSHMH